MQSFSWDVYCLAQAEIFQLEPSYEGSEPSQAELGHFNFQAETELTTNSMYVKKSQNYIEILLILYFFHN